MNTLKYIFIFTLSSTLCNKLEARNNRPNITFEVNNGRLGNHLLTLAKAKALAMKHDFNLYVPEFEFSHEFAFSTIENNYIEAEHINKNKIAIEREIEIRDLNDPNILYVIPFRFHFQVLNYAKSHPDYKRAMQELIKPAHELDLTEVPESKITISLHRRTGGDFDTKHPWVFQRFAHKFSSEGHYRKPIRKILEKHRHQPVHIQLYTDDNNPEKIANSLKKYISGHKNVTFSYRTKDNHDSSNILEDLFSMAQTDYLLRPHSTYSIIAELIGNHKQAVEVGFSKRPTSRLS